MNIENFYLDVNADLSEWLDQDEKNDLNTYIEDLSDPKGGISFHENVFDDCIDMDEESVVADIHHKKSLSVRSASRSPPRRRIRLHSPGRTRQTGLQASQETVDRRGLPPIALTSSKEDALYNAALINLASSMRRSESSRAQVLQNRDTLFREAKCMPAESKRNNTFHMHDQHLTPSHKFSPPAPSTLSSLADLLSGKRTALTAGLEQSRSVLRTYISLINSNQPH